MIKYKNGMYILIALILCIVSIYGFISTNSIYLASESDILASARGMVVIEGNTNKVLYSHNKDTKMAMASLTKIITCIVAIENSNDLDDIVNVSDESIGIEGTSIYLKHGEQLSLRELLLGLMLASGNDCAVAIACHIGGTQQKFVDMMNKFVLSIGAVNTHIINPHGLDADNHYTTAYDLGIITSYALKNEEFREICGTDRTTIRGNDEVDARYLKHKNKLIFTDENCIGVKTGFTDNAGRCLVHATKQTDGMELITVLLNCGPMFEEANRLNALAVNEFEMCEFVKPYNFVGSVDIINGNINKTNVATIRGYKDMIKKSERDKYSVEYDIPDSITAPVSNGDAVGKVYVKYNDEVVFEEDMISIDNVDNIDLKFMLDNILNKWYA